MKNIGGLLSLIGTIALGTVVVVACGGDDVVNQTYTPDGGTSGTASGGTSGGASSSGSGTSSGGTSSSGGTGDGASAFAAAYCGYLAKCSASTFLEFWGDETACEDYFKKQAASDATLSGSATTPAQLTACASKLSAASCTIETFAECQFKGTLADMTPCGRSAQCSGGACVKTAFAACGKCAALGADGADCGSGRAECQAGLYCTPNTQKCTKPLAENADCQAGGTACSPGLKCITKKCTKPLADGADCSGTAAGACAITSFCGTDNKCQPFSSKPGAVGDLCEDLAVGCKLSSCDLQLKPNPKCVALVAENGDCGSRALCQAGLTCRTGKCVKDDASTCK